MTGPRGTRRLYSRGGRPLGVDQSVRGAAAVGSLARSRRDTAHPTEATAAATSAASRIAVSDKDAGSRVALDRWMFEGELGAGRTTTESLARLDSPAESVMESSTA
jgi:hypothetical protein